MTKTITGLCSGQTESPDHKEIVADHIAEDHTAAEDRMVAEDRTAAEDRMVAEDHTAAEGHTAAEDHTAEGRMVADHKDYMGFDSLVQYQEHLDI